MGVFQHLNPYQPGQVPEPLVFPSIPSPVSRSASELYDSGVATCSDSEPDDLDREIDDVQPPAAGRGLAKASIKAQEDILRHWACYSARRHPGANPLDTLKMCEFKNYAGFFIWYHRTRSRCRALASYESMWKRLKQAYYRAVGWSVDGAVGRQINAYLDVDFCNKYGLSRKSKPKPVMGQHGLYSALFYHWKFDTERFDLERNRVQLSGVLLFYAYTGARTGTVIESSTSGLKATNEAMYYRDLRLRLLRSHESAPLLVLEVTIMLEKGKRDRDMPKTITLYENRACPAMCPVIHFAALAFSDNAFHPRLIASGLTPGTMHGLKCPDGRLTIDFAFRKEVLDIPVFRRSVPGLEGRHVDPWLALNGNDVCSWSKKLGERAGFEGNFTPYTLRREVGTQLTDQGVSDQQRNQIMGHSRSETFLKHYLSQNIVIDVQAAFLEHDSNSDRFREIGKMCLRRDSRLPKELSDEEKRAACQTAEIAGLCQRADEARADIKSKFGTIKKSNGTTEGKTYAALRAKIHSLKTQAIKEAFATKLRDFHSSADLEHMAAQLEGREPPSYDIEPVHHVLPERAWLAEKLFEPADDAAFAEIVTAMVQYCLMTEGKGSRKEKDSDSLACLPHMGPACGGQTAQVDRPAVIVNMPKEKGGLAVNRPLRRLKTDVREPKSGPLGVLSPSAVRKRLGPLTCLFCVSRAGRKHTFTRCDGLRKHYRNVHLSHFAGPFPCPIPWCDEIITHPDHFANHAVRIHKSDLGVRAAIMKEQQQPWKMRYCTVVNL